MLWVLGPSARAAYLCVTRHLGLLLGCLIAHRHAAMAAKRPFARGAFSLLAAATARSRVPKKVARLRCGARAAAPHVCAAAADALTNATACKHRARSNNLSAQAARAFSSSANLATTSL